jgi:hypothetical protein
MSWKEEKIKGIDGPDDLELTSEEKMAFRRLPREAEPSELLEERVVRSLREEGILESGSLERAGAGSGPGLGSADGVPSRRVTGGWFRPWMGAAAAAASVALFAFGMVMGQWMGSRTTTDAFMAVREQDANHLALRIQEAGSMYVSALAAMTRLQSQDPSGVEATDPSANAVLIQQGREAAFGALYGAANELARLSPDDADVLRVLQILEERRGREEGWGANDRNTVWF